MESKWPRLTVWTTLLLAMPMSRATAQTNLVSNPDFEAGTSSWELLDYASSVLSGQGRSGSNALRLLNDFTGTENDPGYTGIKLHNVRQADITGMVPGREYVFSVWVAGDQIQGIGNGGKPLAVLAWQNSAGQNLWREMYMWAPYGTYGYRQMSIFSQAPADTIKARVLFRSWWDCIGGYSFWDDISLTPRVVPYEGENLLATLQAEASGNVLGTAHVANDQPGSTGAGYVQLEDTGSFVEWPDVDVGAGSRLLSFRYAMEAAALSCDLRVNGVQVASLDFEPTGSPSSWATSSVSVDLASGANTIRLVVGAGFLKPSIDALLAYGAPSGVDTTPPDTPTGLRISAP